MRCAIEKIRRRRTVGRERERERRPCVRVHNLEFSLAEVWHVRNNNRDVIRSQQEEAVANQAYTKTKSRHGIPV